MIYLCYIDPGDSDVEIILQQKGWVRYYDMLINNELMIYKNIILLRIPMDTLRIVYLELK